ncbi:hypothetical protein [Kocuria flava]|nr:hypothetical protein [Kocuria flava]
MTSPQAAPAFVVVPMLPAPDGRPRAGVVSTTVVPTASAARELRDALGAAARPGTQVLPLTVEAVMAEGPTRTLSGIAGYRLVSRGARPVRLVERQVQELNAAAARWAAGDEQATA